MLFVRFLKMDNSTKRLFEVVIHDHDEVVSQAVDKYERKEAFSNDGLDEIHSQSLDMFEEVKNSVQNAIDISDMLEFGGPSLVMARRFATETGEEIYIFDQFWFYFLANSCYKENCYSYVKANAQPRGLLKNNDRARSARSLFLRKPWGEGIICFNAPFHCFRTNKLTNCCKIFSR